MEETNYSEILEENTDQNSEVAQSLMKFAEKIKLSFYYNFDELIPSIMSDEIDKLLKETIYEGETK